MEVPAQELLRSHRYWETTRKTHKGNVREVVGYNGVSVKVKEVRGVSKAHRGSIFTVRADVFLREHAPHGRG